ncbi:MAG: protease modulator HflC [Sphaerochaetaceae bacterium]|nr:protease modulator HflC [Sphaerochaetaceae bacterium]
MKKLITTGVIALVLIVIFLLLGPFFILEEGELAVITRFGRIVNTHEEAGLKIRVPVVDTVIIYPKKIMSWDGDAQRIPTKENQFIWVDTTARWKIIDPGLFYQSVTTVPNALLRLNDVIDSTIRTVISENYLNEAVRNTNKINILKIEDQAQNVESLEDAEQLRNLTRTEIQQEVIYIGREELSKRMLEMASQFTSEFGIEVIDIVIRQIRYSDDLTQSVYQRMIKERNQIAEAYRSYGEGQMAKWIGKTENDKKVIISQAYAQSEDIKGKADGESTRIYAQSYEADPEFFELWRTLESYRKTIPGLDKILSTDMLYFDTLYGPKVLD